MKEATLALIALAILSLAVQASEPALDPRDQWPQWRGPLATGVAPRGDPPVEWSESANVRWKTPLPGQGHSSPIVWGDRIFLTTAVPHGKAVPAPPGHDAAGAHDNRPSERRQQFMVLAISRRDGTLLWQRTVRDERPHEGSHGTGSWASNSAVTDGERVVAFFGSRGLYCFDMNGKLLWEADLGDMRTLHGHGEGSSPVLYGDSLVVNWDHESGSFIVALDKRTGKQRWKVARDEITSWSTPLIVERGGKVQVIVSATGRVRGYDLADGRLIWECGGLSQNVVASPVAAGGFVYAASSYDRQAMLAIRLDAARGDVTGTGAVAWALDRDTPYVPSPLLYGDMLFFLKHNQGFITNLDRTTGKPLYGPQRLPDVQNVFASPVGAADRVYVVDRGGTTVVLKRGATFELLARNTLEDSFSASPAIAGSDLFLRGERQLYCLAQASPR